MARKIEVLLAKEIVQIFKLFVLCAILVALTYGVLYIVLHPPKNDPVPIEVKNRIRQELNEKGAFSTRGVFSNHSRYDRMIKGDLVYIIMEDKINEVRLRLFRKEIREFTELSAWLIFIGIFGGRYLFLLITWVIRTSKQE